jgi:hypothetical protein
MMKSSHAIAFALSAVAAACSTTSRPIAAPPEVPAALRPPAGEAPFLEALASGIQIYQCVPKVGSPSGFEWVLLAPEASLVDHTGRSIGKHYAGPTWESIDGSKVVGEVKARDAGPDASAIPWLLLNAKPTSGDGAFAMTTSIQRVSTVGGIVPPEPCAATNVNAVARVPYKAVYYFYRKSP